MVGFRRGSFDEKISLYADDTLHYFVGKTGFLQTLMSTINKFGEVSGFTINWSKSILMPLGPLGLPLLTCANWLSPILLNTWGWRSFLSLLTISKLNLSPLLDRQKLKSLSWCKPPMSVEGLSQFDKDGLGSTTSIIPLCGYLTNAKQ